MFKVQRQTWDVGWARKKGVVPLCVMSNFQAFSSPSFEVTALWNNTWQILQNARLNWNIILVGRRGVNEKMSYVTPPFCSLLRKSSGTERDICMILLFAEMRQIVRETCSIGQVKIFRASCFTQESIRMARSTSGSSFRRLARKPKWG